MLFKIMKISHGWFTVSVKGCTLTASNVTGYDVGTELLKTLCDLLNGCKTEERIVWNHEGGEHYLWMGIDGDTLQLEAWGSEDDVLKITGDIIEATKEVLEEFELYENGNGRSRYDHHWNPFPQREYDELKKLVRKK